MMTKNKHGGGVMLSRSSLMFGGLSETCGLMFRNPTKTLYLKYMILHVCLG